MTSSEYDYLENRGQRGVSRWPSNLKSGSNQLFDIIEEGNLQDLRQFLESTEGVDINAENNLGYRPLSAAVLKGDFEMVKCLIQRNAAIKDAHLLAIERGQRRIASFLLNEIGDKEGLEAELRGIEESLAYPSYITPMMLAAQTNKMDMIGMLLDRGHPPVERICPPHCAKCKGQRWYKNYQNQRRSTLLSLANPVYICLIEEDPILASFRLCRQLKRESKIDIEYAPTYYELIERVRKFVASLVSECRDSHETKIVLSTPTGFRYFVEDIELPRLQLAIECNEKSFIAAPPVQRLIMERYHEHRQDWNMKPFYSKLSSWLIHLVVLPFLTIARAIIPTNSFVYYYTTPQSKVINRFNSVVFFNIILLSLIYLDIDRYKEGPPETGLEWVVILWVAGLIRETCQKIHLLGLKQSFKRFWIIYELVLETVFIITFFFWAKAAEQTLEDEIQGKNQVENDRSEWSALNPTLIHEACFAMGTFLSFFFLLYYVQINSVLGPWQASIIKIAKQIYFALTLAALVLLTIAMILASLYHNYKGYQRKTESGEVITQPTGFTSISNSIYSLFWTIFSRAEPSMATVVTNASEDNPYPQEHWMTKTTGYFLYIFFCVFMQIALIISLIAVISNTFQKVIDTGDTEWKVARTAVILTHIQEVTDLPPPFNLIIGLPEINMMIERIQKGRKGYEIFKYDKKSEMEYKVGD